MPEPCYKHVVSWLNLKEPCCIDHHFCSFLQSSSPTEHWTDDLPVCELSGVGFSANQRYRPDGGRREEHEFEDQSFHFHFVDKDICLYGVFDGHSGRKAAEFAAQKLPAELLFGQLTGTVSWFWYGHILQLMMHILSCTVYQN